MISFRERALVAISYRAHDTMQALLLKNIISAARTLVWDVRSWGK